MPELNRVISWIVIIGFHFLFLQIRSSYAFEINYYGILYGPSVGNPSAFQPNANGTLDRDKPVLLKNNLGLEFNLNSHLLVSGYSYWVWKPVSGHDLSMRDPYLRIADTQFFHSGDWNLYADFRVHFPITYASRQNDLLSGLQTFQVLNYQVDQSRFSLGTYASARVNIFGNQGAGNDLELYLGPNLNYQITPTLAATLLYEMGASHRFGNKPFAFDNEGTDLEPGLSWDALPTLNFNPYLHLTTGDQITWQSMSFGMLLYWKLL